MAIIVKLPDGKASIFTIHSADVEPHPADLKRINVSYVGKKTKEGRRVGKCVVS